MMQGTLLPLPAVWYLLSCGAIAICGLIDLRTRLIPNRIIYPFLAGTLVLSLLYGVVIPALLGMILTGGLFLVPRLIAGPRKAGLGDVKLAMLGGMLLGPEDGLYALLITTLAAFLILTPLILTRRLQWKQAIPFGPFLAMGFVATLLIGLMQ